MKAKITASDAIIVNGENVAGKPPHAAARHGVSLVPEGCRIFKRMTVRENLEIGGVTRSKAEIARQIEEAVTLFPRLEERERQRAGTLSGGEQQTLAIGRELRSSPRLREAYLGTSH